MKTVILGKTPYRVLKHRPHYMDLQPPSRSIPSILTACSCEIPRARQRTGGTPSREAAA